MEKKFVVYCMVVDHDEYGIMQFTKSEAGTYEDYKNALIRAYELSSLGYNVKIEEE